MRNPLVKRLPREIKSDLPKYIIIFMFMVIVIGFVSGFLVASGSMLTAYHESYDKYNIEDGNLELSEIASQDILTNIEKNGLSVYDNYYVEYETAGFDSTVRIFKIRNEINKASVLSGSLPNNTDEIAIDRVYAVNNDIEIGDTLSLGGKAYEVSGLIALSDYSALYRSPTDMMFDAEKFAVAVVTSEEFDTFDTENVHYSYSWKYDNTPENDEQALKMSESLLESIISLGVVPVNFIPGFSNQAIHFVGNDMGNDRLMFTVFLYIVVAVLAFIMAITTSNTIAKEANVIGTLRASGYSRAELVIHYLTVPMLVVLVSAIVGNILGYTLFKQLAVDIYYNSYGLPTFEVIWNAEAFVKTTVIPVILMLVINLVSLIRVMKLSPLKFIRRDLSRKKNKKAVRLNSKLGIMTRFRTRIILQNIPNYITIVVGVFLANVILLFGMGMPELLDNNSRIISENMLANYQYILKAEVPTETKGAEKLTTYGLVIDDDMSESVTLYGMQENSTYSTLDIAGSNIYISSGYSAKYDVSVGDTITLKEEFEPNRYEFEVAGIYDYPTVIAVFMTREHLNSVIGMDISYFNAYLSDNEITDIDDSLIATEITEDDLNMLARQLDNSLGSVLDMFYLFGIVMFMLIIYLLSKIVIEKNAQSISMTKILGYQTSEISSLYILSTSIVVVASLLLTMPLVNIILKLALEIVFSTYSGWIPYVIPASTYVKIIVTGIIAYSVVAFVQFRKVKSIPLSEALKKVE